MISIGIRLGQTGGSGEKGIRAGVAVPFATMGGEAGGDFCDQREEADNEDDWNEKDADGQ